MVTLALLISGLFIVPLIKFNVDFISITLRRSWNRAVQLWFHRISQHRPILIIFELLLRETLLYCMIVTVAVHAVANSCCLCN
jgi:hypothetical protein